MQVGIGIGIGVSNGKGAFVTTPQEPSPVETITYLSMDGVDDYIQLPSFTMQKIVIDGYFEFNPTRNSFFFDARAGLANGYAFITNTGSVAHAGGVFTSAGVVLGARTVATFRTVSGADFTDNISIFASNTGITPMKGRLYAVECYDALNNLVARYDMSKGNVQDQSGNGRHATLTGGTWLTE